MRGPRVKIVTLDGDGRERTVFPFWTAYNVGRDVRKYVQSARLTITPCTTPEARAMLREIDRAGKIACFVEGVRVLTGYRADVESGQDSKQKAASAVVTIDDVLGQTVDDALPDNFVLTGLTVRQVSERLYAPYGLQVVVGNEGNRLALSTRLTPHELNVTERAESGNEPELARLLAAIQQEGNGRAVPETQAYLEAHPPPTVQRLAETKESRALHPQPNESVDSFAVRFFREQGLLVWASGDGKVILSAPDWDQEPTYHLIRSKTDHRMTDGRIRSGKIIRQPGRVADEVQVKGRVGRRGATAVVGIARNEEAIALLQAQGRRWRIRKEVDASLRDQQHADRKAATILAQARMAAKTYSCSVAGHGVGIALQAEDQMVHVYDDCAIDDGGVSLDSDLWCVGATFAQNDKGALQTSLNFAWPGSWAS
jgi:prophage tail gpP-like protein